MVTTSTATIIKGVSPGPSSAGGFVSMDGLQVGDVLVKVSPTGFVDGFEPVVTAANQIQQVVQIDWSTVTFTFYLLRGV